MQSKESCRSKLKRLEGKQFIFTVFTVLKRHYPDFNDLLKALPDHRKRSTYNVAEIIMAGLMMFVFKRGAKKHADQMFTGNFEGNYFKLFGMRLPVMETVNLFLKKLPSEELENLKHMLVKQLIEKRVLDKYRFQGKVLVAVDGTGIFSFDKEPFPGCPHKTSKTGKKTWQAGLLEAKIICSNGFSISMETEWYKNSDNIEEKQDCEQKAFVRLAEKLKKNYPRLAITIVADSLYPNDTFFTICHNNNWRFILTFKEGSLKTVWQEVMLLYPLEQEQNSLVRHQNKSYSETSMFVIDLEYKKHTLNWCEYIRKYIGKQQKQERFVHISDIKISKENVWDISYYGRLRWKIENEGFNTQKNGGYNLQHKYSEKNFTAMQNYYQLLQIGHLINQLTEKLQKVKDKLKVSGRTIKSIWEDSIASMLKETICYNEAMEAFIELKQLRY
ncbi:MAG: hypothetical protein GY739_01465 [Mesoflavibacter sp.]|nr:hypothetical protein [Mesoflavibacter sp.]